MSRNYTDTVYSLVKERIINKTYWPGYHVVEENLATEFKMSRSPIRSALQQLYDDGFLVRYAGKGYFVSSDKKCYATLHDIRKGVDSSAAMLVAKRCDIRDLDALKNLAVEADMVEKDNANMCDRDMLFHAELVRLSGSKLIREFFDYLSPFITHSMNLQTIPFINDNKTILASHSLICDCIRGGMLLGDMELAEHGVRVHYAAGDKLYTFPAEAEGNNADEKDTEYDEYVIGDDVKDLFRKKTEIIYRNLFNDIISGKLNEGERINEAKLAEIFNCSRLTVRKAVDMLVKDGYVIIVKNRGAIVQGVRNENHSDLIWARYAIEPVASKLCAENMTNDEKRTLFNIVKAGREAYKTGDYLQSLILDTEFHNCIVKCCGDVHVKKLYDIIAKRTHYERCLLRDAHTNDVKVWPEHNLIYRAISEGNAELSFLAMRSHIKRIYNV